ncbi:MAG: hypothetical protein PHT15_05415 [Gallionellaceae bacterium]|nr:hypothetical protein [Gallionellaceae bacterium]
MSITDTLLLRSLLLFLMLGSVAGLFAGMALIMRPDWLSRVNKHASRWMSTRQFERPLERTVKLDHWFYRHHRTSGILILAGAVYTLYFFTAILDKPSILAGLSRKFPIPPALIASLLDALVLSCVLGAAFALIISLFLLIRPSLLRGFEQGANRVLSLRHALKPLEIQRSGVDEYVLHNVRLAGMLLLFGSLYALVGMGIWMS